MFAQTGTARRGHASAFAINSDSQLSIGLFAGILSAVDVLTIVGSAVAAGALYHHIVFGLFDGFYRYMAFGLVSAALFVPVMFALGAYKPIRVLSWGRQALTIVTALACILCFLTLVMFLMGAADEFSRGTVILFSGIASITLTSGRVVWATSFRAARSRGMLEQRRAMLIGDANIPIDAIQDRLSVAGVTVTHALHRPQVEELEAWFANFDRVIPANINEVIIVSQGIDAAVLSPVLTHLQGFPISVRIVVDPFTADILACPTDRLYGMTVVATQSSQQAAIEYVAKRALDIVISLCAIAMLAPMMVVAAIAIKIEDGGPVFFLQWRKGWNSLPFRIAKFRTMRVMEDGPKVAQATRGDARVTKVGAFLRSRSIDELPQFWNVLRGHMSVVGPRPHALAHDDYYDQLIGKYAFRRRVKPGITGWAQINGLRGETSTVELMEQRVQADLWYIHNWSIWLDLKIIFRTISVFADKGQAY